MRSYSLKQFGTSLSYKRIEKLGDRLEPISRLVDWEEFRKFFERVKNKVGRPPYDPVLMVKVLVLQSWYGISDEEIENPELAQKRMKEIYKAKGYSDENFAKLTNS